MYILLGLGYVVIGILLYFTCFGLGNSRVEVYHVDEIADPQQVMIGSAIIGTFWLPLVVLVLLLFLYWGIFPDKNHPAYQYERNNPND